MAGVPDGAASVELFVVPTSPGTPCCVTVAPVPLRSTLWVFDVCVVGALADTAEPALLLLLPLLLAVVAAGFEVLAGVGSSVAGVVTIETPEMTVETVGWLVGTLAAVGWMGVALLVGLVVAVAVALGVETAVVGA